LIVAMCVVGLAEAGQSQQQLRGTKQPTGLLAACEKLSTNASAPSQCPDTPLFNQAYKCIYNKKCLSGSEVGCVERTGCQYVYTSSSLQAAPTGPLAACEMLSTNASAPSQCPDTPLFNQAYECIYNTKCLTGSEAGCVERTGCQYLY
jgi:hypothetical protein